MEEENKIPIRTKRMLKREEVIEFIDTLVWLGITGYTAKIEAISKHYCVTDRMAKKYIKHYNEWKITKS